MGRSSSSTSCTVTASVVADAVGGRGGGGAEGGVGEGGVLRYAGEVPAGDGLGGGSGGGNGDGGGDGPGKRVCSRVGAVTAWTLTPRDVDSSLADAAWRSSATLVALVFVWKTRLT